jgi:hypothetical protein
LFSLKYDFSVVASIASRAGKSRTRILPTGVLSCMFSYANKLAVKTKEVMKNINFNTITIDSNESSDQLECISTNRATREDCKLAIFSEIIKIRFL